LYTKLKELNRCGDIDLTVISSPKTKDYSATPPSKHIAVNMDRSINPIKDLKSIWELYKVLKREKFDMVHSHTAKAGFISALAAKIARVPFIFHTYHGLPFYEGQNRISYIAYSFLEKTACKFRSHIFTQNKRDMSECIKLIGTKDKVSYEGNGVDIDFVKKLAALQLSEAEKDYPEQGFRIVLLSRLERIKRVDDFLKVACKLISKGIDIACVVAGTGPQEQQLKKQVQEMGLSRLVNMVGRSTRALGLIEACDMVVLCSEKEGIPRSLMEAMALEKPVVATDVLGTQELVVDGQTGFLVPLGDIDKMAEKIENLIKDKSLRKNFGAAGLKRVQEHFNDIKIARLLHEFYLRSAP